MKNREQTNRHRSIVWLLIAVVTALAVSHVAVASTFNKSTNYTVTNLETVDDDLYVWANNFRMQGIVNGDLSCFSYKATTQGEVTQSANMFGREINHTGRVGGAYRAFGQIINVTGYVGRSALLLGSDISVGSGAVIERDLTMFGSDITVEGAVKGNLKAEANRIELSGVIAGDVTLDANEINIIKPAVILGKLTYTSKNQAVIDSANGVTVAGGTTWKLPSEEDEKKDEESNKYTSMVLRLSSLFAAFLFGIIVVRLFRPQAEESFLQLRSRFSVSVAAGLLGSGLLVLCVIVLVFALATMIAGLVVIRSDAAPFGALILIFSLLMVPITSFLSIAGAIIFYSGKIVMGFLIGYLILGRIRQTTHTMSKSGLFLGLVILYGLFAIPYFGFVIYVLISLIGAGAIILGIKHCRRPLLASSENPDLPGDPPPVTPPPPLPPASGVA
jgi:cytoskeletal protein CcmA (bactofilin family)